MDIKTLKCFLDVTSEKNISKVAEKYYISQPALSLQLKKLEQTYGVKLLDRNIRGVMPTVAGQVLAEYCERIINLYDQSFEEIASLKNNQQNIRIESNLTLATYVLPVLVNEMQENCESSNCHFDLTFNTNTPVEGDILSGFSHLGIVQIAGSNPNLNYTKIAEDFLCVVADADYDIPDRITIDQLAEYPVIEVFDKFQERVSVKETFENHGISMDELNIKMSLHSTESVKTAVFGRIGIGLLPNISVKKEISDGRLKAIYVEGFSQKYPVYLVELKDSAGSPAQKEAVKYLKKFTAKYF